MRIVILNVYKDLINGGALRVNVGFFNTDGTLAMTFLLSGRLFDQTLELREGQELILVPKGIF